MSGGRTPFVIIKNTIKEKEHGRTVLFPVCMVFYKRNIRVLGSFYVHLYLNYKAAYIISKIKYNYSKHKNLLMGGAYDKQQTAGSICRGL